MRIMGLGMALLGSVALATACDEAALAHDAMEVLKAHFDLELGAVAAGPTSVAGFQHLKTADALLAAQALAHDDFERAADQFRRLLKYAPSSGSQLPLVVYGPSVPKAWIWLGSNATFFPGPAFWNQTARSSRVAISSVAAPPIAADVAWQIFQLAPRETSLGVVGYQSDAVKFLCQVFEPLRAMQINLIETRKDNATQLLTAHHPWETFSALSPHWHTPLAVLKTSAEYARFVQQIPSEARDRFAQGVSVLYSNASQAVADLYEPMLFLASCIANQTDCAFGVQDLEFNSLVLKSADALVNIADVLVDQSSVCSNLELTKLELQQVREQLHNATIMLQQAVVGTSDSDFESSGGLWNASTRFFDDSPWPTPLDAPSLRGMLPAYACDLPVSLKMSVLPHFFTPSESFHFFCDEFPAPMFTCEPKSVGRTPVTVLQYNYFLQRAFAKNGFPGIEEYVRNKTRDVVCLASAPRMRQNQTAVFAPAYNSVDGSAVPIYEDGFADSTLAAAMLINVLLPPVTQPPSPDEPPINHRMLTAIMVVELVVAFLVAIGCFLFSVYFVANRPRRRSSVAESSNATTVAASRPGRSSRASSNVTTVVPRVASMRQQQQQDDRYDSFSSSAVDLEEALLSEDEEHAYGSFDGSSDDQWRPKAETPTAWRYVKDALSAISPW